MPTTSMEVLAYEDKMALSSLLGGSTTSSSERSSPDSVSAEMIESSIRRLSVDHAMKRKTGCTIGDEAA